MTEADYPAFGDQLHRLARLFRPPAPVAQIADEYWRSLQHLELTELSGRVDWWAESGERFPRPVDLRHCRAKNAPAPLYSYPLATDEELREYETAQRYGWEGDTCDCPQCREASVTDQPVRYVPRIGPDGEDMRRCVDSGRQRYFCLGEWLHGWALQRWHTAQAAFWALDQRKGGRVQAAVTQAATREPFDAKMAAVGEKDDDWLGAKEWTA